MVKKYENKSKKILFLLLFSFFSLRNTWLSVVCLSLSGLSHLVGSSLLRAYMHGYFMDIRLYHKVNCLRYLACLAEFLKSGWSWYNTQYCIENVAVSKEEWIDFKFLPLQVKSMANPFAYEEYRKDKIRQKIEESRTQRVQVKVRESDKMSHLFTGGYSFTAVCWAPRSKSQAWKFYSFCVCKRGNHTNHNFLFTVPCEILKVFIHDQRSVKTGVASLIKLVG